LTRTNNVALHGSLIIFIGNPGCGKTTMIRLLSKVTRLHSSYLKLPFAARAIIPMLGKVLGVSSRGQERLLRIGSYLDLLGGIFYFAVKHLYILSLMHKVDVVLVEEHLPGTIVDYIHLQRILNIRKSIIHVLIKICYYVTFNGVHNMKTIYLRCSNETLMRRWQLRGSPPENLEYLTTQRSVFEAWCKVIGCLSIYNDKNITDTFKELLVVMKE